MRRSSHLRPLALAAVLLSLASLAAALADDSANQKFYGVMRGRVVENQDPLARSRLKVERHAGGEWIEVGWAHAVIPMVDPETVELPEVGDEVLLVFEKGDSERPVVLGTLWSGG